MLFPLKFIAQAQFLHMCIRCSRRIQTLTEVKQDPATGLMQLTSEAKAWGGNSVHCVDRDVTPCTAHNRDYSTP